MESLPRDHVRREVRPAGWSSPDCDVSTSSLGPSEAANDNRMVQLARAIEYEIIPRLMLAHRAGEAPVRGAGDDHGAIGADEVRAFGELVLAQDEEKAFTAIEALRARGVSVEHVYMELLAPTARYLGGLWEEDECSFTDVTVGLGRLQRVLRELSPELGLRNADDGPARRILLLPSPGEQHTFGLVMVGEFFRRAGWDVSGGSWVTESDATALVAAECFDVIGFSVAAEVNLPSLKSTIQAVRQLARNPDMAVIVGGPYFTGRLDEVDAVGADGVTIDGRQAPSMAAALLDAREGRQPG